MSERPKIKVQIEWGDMKHTVEGDLESVVREVMQFAAKVLPNYTLASKLTFTPDYSSMVDDLSENVKLTPEGEAVLLKPELSAENSIALVLLAVRVANVVGTRPTVDMSPEMLSKAIGKSVKTVRNTLALLTKTGVIERTGEGNYKLTIQGIRRTHEAARKMTARSVSSSQPAEVAATG
jgi:DNA-binding transcriptional ArsR family regulator